MMGVIQVAFSLMSSISRDWTMLGSCNVSTGTMLSSSASLLVASLANASANTLSSLGIASTEKNSKILEGRLDSL